LTYLLILLVLCNDPSILVAVGNGLPVATEGIRVALGNDLGLLVAHSNTLGLLVVLGNDLGLLVALGSDIGLRVAIGDEQTTLDSQRLSAPSLASFASLPDLGAQLSLKKRQNMRSTFPRSAKTQNAQNNS
jgi:hypothetical protein